jgi:hypothetical protein
VGEPVIAATSNAGAAGSLVLAAIFAGILVYGVRKS